RFERPTIAGDHLAIGEYGVGPKLAVTARLQPWSLPGVEWSRRTVWPLSKGSRPGRRLDASCRRRMVEVSVRGANVRYRVSTHGVEKRPDMRLVDRTRIDDRDAALAEDVAHCALEGERSRIVAKDAADAGMRLLHLARREIKARVEWDVVAHRPANG